MSENDTLTGVILLAYGGPRNEAEIASFLASVTGGRPLPPDTLRTMQERYAQIGGRSPLPEITDDLAAKLQARLDRVGRFYVTVGNLHSPPSVEDAVADLARHGVGRAVAIVLVPQYSRATVGRYLARLEEALKAAGEPFPVAMVRRWSSHPALIEAFTQKIEEALAGLPAEERSAVQVIFTAHSMPVQAVRGTDVFDSELLTTASDVARRAHVEGWRLAYQSAGRSGGEWLGPSVAEMVSVLAAEGRKRALLVPIHFLADNVEIAYDLDIELKRQAAEAGVEMLRTESLNTSPLLVEALADLAVDPPPD